MQSHLIPPSFYYLLSKTRRGAHGEQIPQRSTSSSWRPESAQVELSGDEEMAAFNIRELEANVPVDFNVYIYLPRNNRYVLYTPCGGVFFSEQKQRLMNQGVSHLHVLRMELSELDKYRAQNFLNDTIQEFEAKEREKIPS